jgi:hypothetical protein
VPAVEVVILRANKELSRTFYEGGYEEGANRRPDCWSSDGVTPDDTVQQPYSDRCAVCQNSQWGSGATAAAPRAQACQQRRRTVVVPNWGDGDLSNEDGGGPVLLSVPPSSLTNQFNFGKMLQNNGIRYYSCVVQLSFDQDPKLAFPRLEFTYLRPLTDDEATQVLTLRQGDQIDRILQSKINVDGPEVDGPDGPAGGVTGAGAAAPVAAGPAAPKQGSTVRPPQGQPAQATATQARVTQAAPAMNTAGQQPQRQPQQARAAQGQPAQATTQRPTVQNPGTRTVQQPQGQPAQQTRPVQPPQGQPAQQAPAGRPVRPGAGGITEAVSRPAQPPASQRTVQRPQTPPPPVEDQNAGQVIEGEAEVIDDGMGEGEAEGQVPNEMSNAFDDLMARQ